MAIVNRDGDASEQKEVFTAVYGNLTGVTLAAGASLRITGPMPYPFLVESGALAAFGLSGAPQVRLILDRFTSGGQTRMVCGISNMVTRAYLTSGIIGWSGLAPVGSTLLQGQAGDQLSLDIVGANTALTDLLVNVVVKKSQDIVSYNGVVS